MTEQLPRETISFHEASLIDGGPENYKLWYKDYDNYTSSLGWIGPENTIITWMKSCENECKKQGMIPKDFKDACKKLFLDVAGRKIKVYDAGCGTGRVAEKLISQSGIPREDMEIFGGDYSSDMIGMVEKKQIYDHLRVDNLKEALVYQDNEFDCIFSAGVFLYGHCGPECIPNIIRVLKPGCFFVSSVRAQFYYETKEEWIKQIEACGCDLVSDQSASYLTDIEGIIVVIQKKRLERHL